MTVITQKNQWNRRMSRWTSDTTFQSHIRCIGQTVEMMLILFPTILLPIVNCFPLLISFSHSRYIYLIHTRTDLVHDLDLTQTPPQLTISLSALFLSWIELVLSFSQHPPSLSLTYAIIHICITSLNLNVLFTCINYQSMAMNDVLKRKCYVTDTLSLNVVIRRNVFRKR